MYDSDGGGWVGQSQMFIVDQDNSIVIKSAGLTEDVELYQMVGTCMNCATEDVLWEVVYRDSQSISLGPSNNAILINEPGKYSLGDPNDPPSFVGDVNILAKTYKGVDISLVGKSQPSDSNPLPVEVAGNDCDNPVHVKICDIEPYVVNSMNMEGSVFTFDPVLTDDQGDTFEYAQIKRFIYSNGTLGDPFYINPVTGEMIMTGSSDFMKQGDSVQYSDPVPMKLTDDADNGTGTGEVKTIFSRTVTTNGTPVQEYYESGADGQPDYSAVFDPTGAGTVDEKAIRMILGDEAFDITTDTALPNIPDFATYAEIYLEASDSVAPAVQWAKNASAPADGDANEEDKVGTTIRLYDRDEIEGFLASSANADGTINGTDVVKSRVVWWNIAPDED